MTRIYDNSIKKEGKGCFLKTLSSKRLKQLSKTVYFRSRLLRNTYTESQKT